MTKQEIQKRLKIALEKSPYRFYVQRISFGSELHGTTNPESDIDLLIELSKPMSMLKLVHLERDLSEALGKKVDLNTAKSLSRYFRSDIEREAEAIFETITS